MIAECIASKLSGVGKNAHVHDFTKKDNRPTHSALLTTS